MSRIQQWFATLWQAQRQAIQAGQLEVLITGYSSPTGGEAVNLRISKARAEATAALVRQTVGSHQLRIRSTGVGTSQAISPRGVNGAVDLRATISLSNGGVICVQHH